MKLKGTYLYDFCHDILVVRCLLPELDVSERWWLLIEKSDLKLNIPISSVSYDIPAIFPERLAKEDHKLKIAHLGSQVCLSIRSLAIQRCLDAIKRPELSLLDATSTFKLKMPDDVYKGCKVELEALEITLSRSDGKQIIESWKKPLLTFLCFNEYPFELKSFLSDLEENDIFYIVSELQVNPTSQP